MTTDTFEGWCTPVSFGNGDIGKYADHTFVYCTNKDSSFKCWGSANRNDPYAAKVCSGEDNKAYCRANKYRLSIGNFEDTAGVGVYAINGVCHQSANLFLYSAGITLPLNQPRPRGILASHALYGIYGSDYPGGTVTWLSHFAAWNTTVYTQAKVRCWFSVSKALGVMPDSSQDLISKITQLHFKQSSVRTDKNSPSEIMVSSLVPQEMELLFSHYLTKVDSNIIRKVHEEIISRKEEIFSKYGLFMSTNMKTVKEFPKGKSVEDMVKELNGLALEFQSQLAEKLGSDDFVRINGDKNYYCPIDPDIARQAFDSIRVE